MGWTRIASPGASPAGRAALARDAAEAVKARFEPEAWQRVARPIFDRLRRLQRDALVAHVRQQHGFTTTEQLYEYFLIDPGMEPVVQTSRIRLAIGAVQLFIQRCLLNLEAQVHPVEPPALAGGQEAHGGEGAGAQRGADQVGGRKALSLPHVVGGGVGLEGPSRRTVLS